MHAKKYLSSIAGLDLRGLSLFRVFLGLIIVFDIIHRWFDIEWFYTDNGFWPRLFVSTIDKAYFISLHMLDGSVEWQHFLFFIHLMLAIAFILAIKIRTTTLFLWIFQVSLITRNIHVSAGFDDYITCLLLVSLFLPIGRYFTLSDYKNKTLYPDAEKSNHRWTNLLFVAQVFSIHFLAGWIKDGNSWLESHTALSMIYNSEHLSSSFGLWLGQHHDFLMSLTPYVRWVEFFVPFTLFIPRLRFIMILFIIFLHSGIFLTLNAFTFPFVNIITILPLLPSSFWDKIFNKKRKHHRFSTQKKTMLKSLAPKGLNYADQVMAFCLLTIMLIQVVKFGTKKEQLPGVPKIIHQLTMSTLFYQRWLLFGPEPFQKDGYFLFEGENEKGEVYEIMGNNDVLNGKTSPQAHQVFKNRRWSRYLLDPTVITTPALHLQTARGFCAVLRKDGLSSINIKYHEVRYQPLTRKRLRKEYILARTDCNYVNKRSPYMRN
ncbi:MAG: hypothetical protein ACO20H_06165 [Bacteriovoracaceae bacterium]